MCRGEGVFFGAGNTNLVGGKESTEAGDYQIFEAYCPETQSNEASNSRLHRKMV